MTFLFFLLTPFPHVFSFPMFSLFNTSSKVLSICPYVRLAITVLVPSRSMTVLSNTTVLKAHLCLWNALDG